MLNLSVLLEHSARTHPDRDAVVLGDIRLTYAALDAYANRVANLLVERGVKPGEKVALSCPNTPEFVAVYYGILKAGAVVVPLNLMLKRREIAYHLADSDAVAYFCFEGSRALPMGPQGWAAFGEVDTCEHFFLITAEEDGDIHGAERLVDALAGCAEEFESVATEATDTAVILYTSGTTGRPKGAELTHANLVLNTLTCRRQFGSHPEGHERHLVALPLFHSFGSTVQLNSGISDGATLVLLPRFDASSALGLLEREEITFFAGVPTMYWGLMGALNDGVDVDRIARNLRVAVSGGAALSVEMMKDFQARFHVQILEGYGLSETSPLATFSDRARPSRAGSIGVPIWGVECRLVDEDWHTVEGADRVGEIAIRGHNVMKGYYNRPEATAEVIRDGWFRTGDLARRDADGFYYIVDRAKDLIIRGGFNVYPREIEEVLMAHPAVSLAAVVGVPHQSHGEEIKAYVIRHDDADLTEEALVAWAKEQMAAYKYPRQVEYVDSLPMTSTGKILKRELGESPAESMRPAV
ncbi:long-chain-fatty-acid--CoA ligase [Nocardioides insulae]|uniref:long-chain-fatty-acid--CoA ligase n=1 Tax=Nocardioides insulae TaxID=394734 RepID=UPI000428FF92|nr:long-chain fatty acid--CoA ligase [Nocardioides insulae]